jgi:hypothetical protein
MSIESLKHKLHTHCGSSVNSMVLQLKDETGQLVAVLNDDCRKLGFYSPRNGWVAGPTWRGARAANRLASNRPQATGRRFTAHWLPHKG